VTGKNMIDDPDSTHMLLNREINLFLNSSD
jgi:hypothetical protein